MKTTNKRGCSDGRSPRMYTEKYQNPRTKNIEEMAENIIEVIQMVTKKLCCKIRNQKEAN